MIFREAEIDCDSFAMTNVQETIGFGGKLQMI